jgi:pimeloyl-ACP methyl ester carboxylesterase
VIGTSPAAAAPPDALEKLIYRYDPSAFDAPVGRSCVRLAISGGEEWDVLLERDRAELAPPDARRRPDATLTADEATWRRIARDLRGGMEAFQRGRLRVRRNLHLGVGFLAATSGLGDPRRLELKRVRVGIGNLSIAQAGAGEPVVALHGLGGTKSSFLPTIAALAGSHRVIALDFPGFGESVKPLGARYDSPFLARSVVALLDALGIQRAHLVGNSMGGRVALEVGMRAPDRLGRLVLLCPALAWLRERRWAPLLRLVRPELGLIQVTPRRPVEAFVRRLIPGATDGWAAAGVDEFLRAYLTPRGRAAFYAAARNIYLDQPHGPTGFWTRLRDLEPDALFVWGRRDQVVPIAFARHVERALPAASHLELDCGHVPQVERPRETHAAIGEFLAAGAFGRGGRAAPRAPA